MIQSKSTPSIEKSSYEPPTRCGDLEYNDAGKTPWQETPLAVGDTGSDLELSNSSATGPPDGGWLAWNQALMGHIVVFNTWGFINSFGIFQTYYVEQLALPPSDVSWIGSITIFLLFFIGAFSGRATDAGYFRLLLLSGSVLQVLGVFMTSLCTQYWQLLLAQGVCFGVGNGLLLVPCLTLVATYFSSKRALAMGVVLTGSSTGSIVFPLVAQRLLSRIGFPWTMRVIGFIMLGLYVVANAFMRTRLPPRKLGPIVDWRAFKELPYAFFCIGMFLTFMGVYVAFYYVGSFGRTIIGISYADSITVLVIMNSAGIPGRLIPNSLADRRLGCLNVQILLCCCGGITLLCWIPVSDYKGLIIFSAIYGFFGAGIQSIFAATIASLTADIDKTGVRIGMAFSFTSIACLTGSPIAGAIIQSSGGDYVPAQIYSGVAVLAGTMVLVGARIVHTG